VFYLPEPPLDFKAMRDFRRLPGVLLRSLSPELRFEIRRAQDRRDLAIELWESAEGTPPTFPHKASLGDNSEEVATRIREALGVRYESQIGWTGYYQPFNNWRAALESAGVLVFQAVDVEVSEVRGFSIGDQPLPAVIVNIRDTPRGRTFTMLHELAHIMLGHAGLCDLDEEADPTSEEERVEVFCNRVAGAAIVPRATLLQEDIVRDRKSPTEWSDDEIRTLANRYGASRETLLRRLLICGRANETFYRRKREQFLEEYKTHRQRVSGFAPPDVIAVSRAGKLFVRLVLDNYYQDRVTASDVSDFLEVRLKHLSKIEAQLQASTS
jgi:Zn-dependent peptidase ImmA (M78 family)